LATVLIESTANNPLSLNASCRDKLIGKLFLLQRGECNLQPLRRPIYHSERIVVCSEMWRRRCFVGGDEHGQCATGGGGKCNAVVYPTPMVDVYHPETKRRVSFVNLALGKMHHAVGLTHQGELYSWGSTASGRCGHGDGHSGSGSGLKSAFKM